MKRRAFLGLAGAAGAGILAGAGWHLVHGTAEESVWGTPVATTWHFAPMPLSESEGGFLAMRRFTRQEIARLYGVPERMLPPNSVGAGAAFRQLRDAWYEQFVGPHAQQLARAAERWG